MSLFSKLLAITVFFLIISCILYVLFGQLTVRRLRKNPETKAALGLEMASGLDIINVAQALALPKSWSHKLENSDISFMYAKASILYQYTNRFDRFLAGVFYWLLTISGLSAALLILLNALGVFTN